MRRAPNSVLRAPNSSRKYTAICATPVRYLGFDAAMRVAEQTSHLPPPLDVLNAPTKLMKQLDYGRDYKYAHNEQDAIADMSCLPPALEGRTYYEPSGRGFEKEIKRRLDGWDAIKKRRRAELKGEE